MDRSAEFIEAVKKNDLEKLKYELDADISLLYARSKENISAVMMALYYMQKPAADLLVSRGLTLDIFEASAYGDIARVGELLKDRPSLLNEYSADGWTPLHLAAYFGNQKVVALLLDLDADISLFSRNPMQVTALHSALSSKQWDAAFTLIKKGADIHAKTSGSLYMPIHYTAANGNLELTKFLISLGVDMYSRTSDGKTPLHLAEEKGHADIVQYLRQQSAE